MNTTLVKLNDNEYRVQDIVKFDNGRIIDYTEDFDKNSYNWHEIVIDMLIPFGIKPITVWNRSGFSFNPLLELDFGGYIRDSDNPIINLISYLHNNNIIDNNIIKSFQKWGNRDHLNNEEITNNYFDNKTILVEVYHYGFSNKLVAEVYPQYCNWNMAPLIDVNPYRPNRYSEVKSILKIKTKFNKLKK